MQILGCNGDLTIAALDALEAGDQESIIGRGFDHPAGDDGEGENEDDIAIDTQAESQFAFVIVGAGQAQCQGEAIAPFREDMERDFFLEDLTQEVVGKHLVQGLVMVEETGGALRNGEAFCQIIANEEFEGESWVALDHFRKERNSGEEVEDITEIPDMEEGATHPNAEPKRCKPQAALGDYVCRRRGCLNQSGSGAIIPAYEIDSPRHLSFDLPGLLRRQGVTGAATRRLHRGLTPSKVSNIRRMNVALGHVQCYIRSMAMALR